MRPRVGVRPIVGASTGLLLAVLAAFLFLWIPVPAPPTPAPPALTIPPDTVVAASPALPVARDTLPPPRVAARVIPQRKLPALAKPHVTRPAHVGVSIHWPAGRTRAMLSGELPVVTGLKKKTTLAFEALVTASGRVVRVYVPQGSRTPVLLNRAVAAARAWQFERLPRNRNGVSERCRIILTFRPADG